jgi:hypothetical protein
LLEEVSPDQGSNPCTSTNLFFIIGGELESTGSDVSFNEKSICQINGNIRSFFGAPLQAAA